jgi:hypothetical protein
MTYPDGIDALVNVNAGDTLAAGGHAARHNSVNTALVEVKDYLGPALASKLDLAGGKILQIVRATDSTNRTTTSVTFVDASITVTITPQKSDSEILLMWLNVIDNNAASRNIIEQITDNSNNALSGAEGSNHFSGSRLISATCLIGRSTPATTSPVTYKGRFRAGVSGDAVNIRNDMSTGQLYAIEVSA